MTKEELLRELEEIFEMNEGELKPEQSLRAMDAFDSMSILSVIALFDGKLSKTIGETELKNASTVSDLIKLAGL